MAVATINQINAKQKTAETASFDAQLFLKKVAICIKNLWNKFIEAIRNFVSELSPETSTSLGPESDKVRKRKINQIIDLAQSGFIYFYDKTNPKTAFLGNFYPCKLIVVVPQNGQHAKMQFLNAEAAYQACKFSARPDLQQELTKLSGQRAWEFAQNHKNEMDSHLFGIDWFNSSDRHMKRILHAKFSQNPHLKERLLATSDAYLVEHTTRDTYWGDGGTDGNAQPLGKNRLGHMLMELRQELGGANGVMQRPEQYLQKIYDIETKHMETKDKLCAVSGCAFPARNGNGSQNRALVCHPRHLKYVRL